MIGFVLKKILGTQNERQLKRVRPILQRVNALENTIEPLTDAMLRGKTDTLRQRLKDGESLDDLLPEAFAVVREVAKRRVNMRPFDVQVIGGAVLHEGMIAEMATGEGKTLVATMPVYLNALTGKGVHVVTVNDYLASRDRDWMGPIYEALGLTVGTIQHDLEPPERQVAYGCDVTYGTNNEFGFDYLRDNMVMRKEDQVHRPLHYAIVDEVDSILVDEARTPLIISGPAEESTELYYKVDRLIPKLQEGKHFEKDEKLRTAALTEDGVTRVEELLKVNNLYDEANMDLVHHVSQALMAHSLFQRDVHYMVKDDGVVIVDSFTGRLMPGRRFSEGLHQALEAKEGVTIERENQTLASVTFQNYFRMYEKLSGMTGTAATEALEFQEIYKLQVVEIPTNRPLRREAHSDVIYKTEREKFEAVADEIRELQSRGQPVLVGTISIEKSELLSQLLTRHQIPHSVLNAKYHEREAHIIAQAGRSKGVTIATNMAGRGTDILLGGNADFLAADRTQQREEAGEEVTDDLREQWLDEMRQRCQTDHDEVIEQGGLYVLGTERHEARRIDNQLRGRSGRQGDPGEARFFLSLEDDLLRIFGSDRIAGLMDRLGMEEGEDIQHPMVTRAIETAQKRVESHNFDIRKHLLEYDNVMNEQREVIYADRRRVLEGGDLRDRVQEMLERLVEGLQEQFLNPEVAPDEWDVVGLSDALRKGFGIQLRELCGRPLADVKDMSARDVDAGAIAQSMQEMFEQVYAAKEATVGSETMRPLEQAVLLHVIDSKWKEHLHAMDTLREGIGLRAYGQRDPLIEYKHEAFDMFSDMMDRVESDSIKFLLRVQATNEPRASAAPTTPRQFLHPSIDPMAAPQPDQAAQAPPLTPPGTSETRSQGSVRRTGDKVGRNDPCPCGSGKKYKKCHAR